MVVQRPTRVDLEGQGLRNTNSTDCWQMDRILNRMKDIVYDPSVSHRRRRLEYPRRNESCFLSGDARIPDDLVPTDVTKCGGEAENFGIEPALYSRLLDISRVP